MTPEETKIAEQAKAHHEAEEQRKAYNKERYFQQARQRYKNEEAAKRPAPVLVFDGEENWSPLDWLIDRIIPAEGAGELFGETDIGKTFVAVSMAISVCADDPWHEHPVAHGTVLFIEAEGGHSFPVRKHAAKLEAGVTPNLLKPFPFVTNYEALGFGPDTDLALVLARAVTIRDEVAKRGLPAIRFVVTDTLAQNIHGDADSNADMTAFLRLFRAFLKALSVEPVFGLLIHHPGHNNKDRARGAYALPADLDLIMQLEGTPDALTLSCDRMRDGERFAPILLALEKRTLMLDDGREASTLVVVSRTETGAAPVDSYEAQIVRHLRTHPRQTTTQLSTDLHIRKSIVVKKVDALCDDGTLRRVEVKGATGQTKQLYEVAPDEGSPATQKADDVSDAGVSERHALWKSQGIHVADGVCSCKTCKGEK